MKKYMHTLKKAFVATLPVMAAYLVLGAGFGIVLKTKGYGIIWAIAMSLLIYAGSMQFVAINLISGGASYLTIALTTLMVNARHLFYGISMIDKY
ncbi:MAG: AzlC family ABC transporter permease, partial [Acetivibrio ethanolgignens]